MPTINRDMNRDASLSLRIVIFQEGGAWVAQVLERDMAAHGKTPYSALAAVQLAIQAHVNFDTRLQRVPLSRLKPAPDAYVRAFERGEPLPMANVPMLPAYISAAIASENPCKTA